MLFRSYSIGPCGAAILGVPAVILMPVSGVLLRGSPTLAITWPLRTVEAKMNCVEAAQVYGIVSCSSISPALIALKHILSLEPSHDK